jgi:integrase/recombinase XerD
MSRAKRLYLPYAAWSAKERNCWEAAFRAGADLFDERGSGAHLAERSRLQLQYAYGKFLLFISTRHHRLLAGAPADRLNRAIIEDYVKWHPKTCGDVTIAIYLYHLWLTLRYISPSENWSWLLAISNRMSAKAKRKREKHHLITSETLYALGIELMDGAIATGNPAETRAAQTAYRDGLIIALLALIPMRRRTLAALRVGKHLVRSGRLWVLEIPAEDTKTRQPIEYPISAELTDRIDLYLKHVRSRIPGAAMHDHVWASTRGRPMGGQIIYNAVCWRTRKALGFAVNLQRFRIAAATFGQSETQRMCEV